jgi:hypothetical protein
MSSLEFFAGVALPVLLTVFFAVTPSRVSSRGFGLCRAFLALAVIDAVGCLGVWLRQRDVIDALWWTAAVGGAVLLGPLSLAGLRWVDRHEQEASSRLVPGKLPRPRLSTTGTIPDDALVVMLGSVVAWTTRLPHTILTMGSQPMLAIDRHMKRTDELAVIVLRVFDDRNNIIARIDEDGFWVEPSTRKKRPSPDVLVVYDHHDAEVLRVHFLNPTTLSVTGVFRFAGRPNVVITPEAVLIGRLELQRVTIGNCGTDIDIA